MKNVLVATNTGRSVEAAQEIMGEGFNYFAVGNPVSSRDKGYVLHEGISGETTERLEARGITVIEQDLSIFQSSPSQQANLTSYHKANKSYIQRFGRTFEPGQAPGDICKILGHVLAEFFGDGPKVCMEIALMAADSGKLPLDQDCMAIATPRGYSNAALIVHPVSTSELFSTHFRVKDLLLAPSDDDIWFNDGAIP